MKEETGNRNFLIIIVLIFFLALSLRIYLLEIKPIHHDEAILKFYYINPLLKGETLNYLGTEYHGLFYHFLAFSFIKIFGDSLFSLRFSAALFGALTVFLLYFLRDELGRIGVIVSALFLAVSPTLVYYSRQYLSYPFFIFFLLLFVVLCVKFSKNNRYSLIYFIAIVAAILLNINEAFLIFIFISLLFFYLFYLITGKSEVILKKIKSIKIKHFILAFLAFLIVFIAIQTVFFTNLSNISGLLDAFSNFSSKAVSTGQSKPILYYFGTLIPIEIGLLVMFLFSLFFHRKNIFSAFVIFWAILNLLILSLIGYKTNWVLTIFIFPLILSAGIAGDYLMKKSRIYSILVAFLVIVTLIFSIQQNFIYVNNFDKNKLGYAETSKDINRIVYEIKEYSGSGKILIVADSYWPLPFYLQDYPLMYLSVDRVNFTEYKDYDLFIIEKSQVPENISEFTIDEFEMRQNYNLDVLFRKNQNKVII
jgi:uncharacterized protein (TIGR03663 family)